ncbi:SusC/RagA family TonB-linked outer membrane protein [Sphingobacterium faecale]|uniref:TonB-dependent receptor n=1 Tax=Sphingobacterium faecale TaxID=2803775 RepID=A0ABS1R4W9_9SPHI|nr:TonB-dependent receptor [Sphingobacterium faecale]MBL1409330.1 TonB-dependent receptor [Sphingobacterium faecale]
MRKSVLKLLGIYSLLLISISLSAQHARQEISGKVTDERGEYLSGVSISVMNEDLNTTTNDKGEYRISVPINRSSFLLFSYVGMKSQKISVQSTSNTLNLVMLAEAFSLDEVVAIGYGTAKKKDITGSVASVEGGLIAKRNMSQLSQALQGTVPGLMVTRTNSQPGAGATIRVRGITTIGDSNPLVIVDGVPVNSINDVNPQDIQDISVLKDAASASIYGARAAAGVILITTKRANIGQTNLDYNGTYGVESATRFPEMVGAQRYLDMINEFTWNDAGNKPGEEYGLYSKDIVDNWIERNKTDPDRFPITAWIDLMIKDYAPRHNHHLGVTTGGDRLRTRASVNYEKSNGLYDYNSFERVSTRVNNRIKVNDFIAVDVDMSYNSQLRKLPSINPIESAQRYAPIYAATWADGRIAGGKNGANIYARLHHGGSRDESRNIFSGRAALEIKPIQNLTLTGVFAPQIYNSKSKDFNKQIPYYDADDPALFIAYIEGHESTSLTEGRTEGKVLTTQFLANYKKQFAEHSLDGMLGYEDSYNFVEGMSGAGENFELSEFPYLDLAPLDFQKVTGNAYETSYRSFFGRIMYDFKERYLLQANIRYDGSSRFHPDHRWGAFPSVSAGWVLTKENFIPTSPILSYLKLRASWGQLGNERIGNYPYQSSLNYTNALFYRGNNIVSATTAAQVSYAIKNITWEVTESKNIGIDAYFLNNRLGLTADYYHKTTNRMLLKLEIPDFMGYGKPSQNAGTMNTKGWDTQLTWRDKKDKFHYSISLNVSDSKSVMGNLSGLVLGTSQITREGSEYNEWYGYLSDGLYQTADEVANQPKLYPSVKPGDIKYKDISGPDGVPDGKISPDYDMVLLGGSLPRYIFGGQLEAGYAGIDFAMAIQGVGKQNNMMPDVMVRPFISAWTTPPSIIDGNYWSMYNTEEKNLEASYPRLSVTSANGNNYMSSDFWRISGAYFRVKNITLGYTLPEKINKHLKVSNLRIYGSATDLLSFDKYPTGWDPEAVSNSYITKSFLFGLSLKF